MDYVRVTNLFFVMRHKHPTSMCRGKISWNSSSAWHIGAMLGESKRLLAIGPYYEARAGICCSSELSCVLDASALLTVGSLSADISRHWQAQPWHWQGCVQWRHLGEAHWWFSWRALEAWLLTLAQRYSRVAHRANDGHHAIMQELISEDQWGMSLPFSGEIGEKLRWTLLSVRESRELHSSWY